MIKTENATLGGRPGAAFILGGSGRVENCQNPTSKPTEPQADYVTPDTVRDFVRMYGRGGDTSALIRCYHGTERPLINPENKAAAIALKRLDDVFVESAINAGYDAEWLQHHFEDTHKEMFKCVRWGERKAERLQLEALEKQRCEDERVARHAKIYRREAEQFVLDLIAAGVLRYA